MISSYQAERLIAPAEQHYSYELPYHNWTHATAVMANVREIITNLRRNNILIEDRPLQVAAAWHDAGYHEDHISLGYETKEEYSAALLDMEAESQGIPERERVIMTESILGTQHRVARTAFHACALQLADIQNIGGPQDAFIENTLMLFEERNLLSTAAVTWEQHVAGSSQFIQELVEDLRVDLPKLGMPVHTADSFDTHVSTNLDYLKSLA